ncbi:MAG: hypothetical protein AAB767_03135, partial [Patescibacteria group bacterium]
GVGVRSKSIRFLLVFYCQLGSGLWSPSRFIYLSSRYHSERPRNKKDTWSNWYNLHCRNDFLLYAKDGVNFISGMRPTILPTFFPNARLGKLPKEIDVKDRAHHQSRGIRETTHNKGRDY